MPSRQNQSRVTLTVDGVDLGVWDDKTGGDTDTNSTQYFLGGMGDRVSLGGAKQVSNVVLMRLEDDVLLGFAKWLTSRSGKGKAIVVQQKVDDDGNPIHEPFGWKGRVKRAKLSDVQSQGNSAAVFELEIEIDGQMF